MSSSPSAPPLTAYLLTLLGVAGLMLGAARLATAALVPVAAPAAESQPAVG
ncbi:MAG TPA: hypothetical protein VFV27_02375 [Nevskiaceae bacterium]|nr:hypothetical protein [Nevskiaceae bacterium]